MDTDETYESRYDVMISRNLNFLELMETSYQELVLLSEPNVLLCPYHKIYILVYVPKKEIIIYHNNEFRLFNFIDHEEEYWNNKTLEEYHQWLDCNHMNIKFHL